MPASQLLRGARMVLEERHPSPSAPTNNGCPLVFRTSAGYTPRVSVGWGANLATGAPVGPCFRSECLAVVQTAGAGTMLHSSIACRRPAFGPATRRQNGYGSRGSC